MLRIIAATRHDRAGFHSTLLGGSISRCLQPGAVAAKIAFQNSLGLPVVYNAALDQADEDDTLLFVHDDVSLDDWLVGERIREGLERFDVVGVVGNRRRAPRHSGWAFIGEERTHEDLQHLSGAIFQMNGPRRAVLRYGPAPAEVKLLDGVFLAVHARTLRASGVRFDPRFAFHFYDLDFCGSCEAVGLRMGTWPIAVSHGSMGSFGTTEWHQAYGEYRTKWGES